MRHAIHRHRLLAPALAGIALVAAFFAGQATAPGPAVAAAPAAATQPARRLYELRIYTAAPGKLEALNRRFRDHTLRLFERHGITNVGYWVGTEPGQTDKLYYVIAYPDPAARERMLVNGIAKDPEFLKAVAESERDGKLTSKVESVLLDPTDYSPLK
ncbi:MAG TPA: NIPSNAP family protein [Humisphaera sp.]